MKIPIKVVQVERPKARQRAYRVVIKQPRPRRPEHIRVKVREVRRGGVYS